MTAADRRESLDAYRPAEIARVARAAGTEKAAAPIGPLVTRAMLTGADVGLVAALAACR